MKSTELPSKGHVRYMMETSALDCIMLYHLSNICFRLYHSSNICCQLYNVSSIFCVGVTEMSNVPIIKCLHFLYESNQDCILVFIDYAKP